MTKRIKTTGQKTRFVRPGANRDEGTSGKEVAYAVGAESLGVARGAAPSMYAELGRQLYEALKSRGGRPGLEGIERRQKIPMTEQDWQMLEEIARTLARDGFVPTAGQVASRVLHDALARFGRPSPESAPDPGLAGLAGATRACETPAVYRVSSTITDVSAARRRHLERAQEMAERPAA